MHKRLLYFTYSMFIQGDETVIKHLFNRQKGCGTDMSIVIQSMLQRVIDLEKSLTEKEKTIQSKDSKINCKFLELKHNNLQADYVNNTLEAEVRGRFTKYDSSQKRNLKKNLKKRKQQQ